MKRLIMTILAVMTISIVIMAQERTVENRPYTDLRPFHFGVMVGTHFQDLEFTNTGLTSYIDADGNEKESNVTVDQDRWDAGFTSFGRIPPKQPLPVSYCSGHVLRYETSHIP